MKYMKNNKRQKKNVLYRNPNLILIFYILKGENQMISENVLLLLLLQVIRQLY